ncbi:hopanoid-associated phosphorylase [Enhydrobacter aerosaccus]|uniref:Hopanoid-associated phosphorylase n=1 Tax=Enhydrobacter aerosaccus TaxID=225324 RepID=A0A1T4NTX1_9HYPH|nr:hopanoid-associated phosphorylase [Enhydrobacter aerosaccus]SJZ82694.1 hopanoid-associated phosphorylase [Enhydrobacter aerosaccus]
MTILVATGLERERHLLAGPDLEIIAGGGDHERLEVRLEQLGAGKSGLISIGIAGGLAPDLVVGQWVVATAVLDRPHSISTDVAWTERLVAALPGATRAPLLGSNEMIVERTHKAALHRATGAAAVDMESHIAARVAQRLGLPFAAARVVCDPAHRSLPRAAQVGMRPDGGMDIAAVLRSLLADPRQLPALIRTGWEAEKAFRALLRGHRLLGRGLAGPDLG